MSRTEVTPVSRLRLWEMVLAVARDMREQEQITQALERRDKWEQGQHHNNQRKERK